MKETTCECHKTVAFMLLRLFLAMLFIVAFLGKLKGEGNDYALANLVGFSKGLVEQFAQATFLPRILLIPFCWALPWLEVIFGVALLLGIKTRCMLMCLGFLMLALCFGMMLMKQHDTVAKNAFYLFLIVTALYLLPHNRCCLVKDK
ncbi:MAG: DoxX family protein [Verrucomicrobiae bacterium]|nr:DoxX family protein [Verrucomicrobiae bacterium]